MRILISQELTATALRQLFENTIDILRVPGFYPEEAAVEIARRFDRSNLRGPYDGAPNIDRIGRALFEKQISPAAAAEYEAHSLDWIDELRGAVRPLQLPIDLLRLKLDELHLGGSTLATIEGTRAFCGLIRIFPAGGEAEPHMDVLAWDLPDGHPDGRLLGQFAAGPLETRTDIDELVAELRRLDDGDVWMLGGGQLQMAFLERDALDEIEIFVFPELLGGGSPLFPPTGLRASPTLVSAKALDRGCVRMHYAFTS